MLSAIRLFSSSEDIRSASFRPRSWQASHAPHDDTDRKPPHPRRPYSPECVERLSDNSDRPHHGLPKEAATGPETAFGRLSGRRMWALMGTVTIYQTVSGRDILRSSPG